ncbi:MAG: tagaturonate epimerase family protein [Bacteroidaceae bacterium]|nr:tagaturonate epimerase family protein [Bacteroidaceae bacterium]
MKIGKYSFGIGDRFSHEGEAQLNALIRAEKELGLSFVPVWNKSNREHQIVGTDPSDTRREADAAVRALGYDKPYFVDADHINLGNVDRFIEASDFFTIDVADYIGKPAPCEDVEAFVKANTKYLGCLSVPGIDRSLEITEQLLREMADRYLYAVIEAGRIYRHIADRKGADNFVTEISMDEVEAPQTPLEMFFILSAIAAQKIPVQTIAPKFTGRFNKGVDYVGDLDRFAVEFEEDLLVIDYAVREFGLPDNLKLSIHSGSDKFSIYPIMGRLVRKYDKGIHIKTAGTTWLEEIIGLALSDDMALKLAKRISTEALGRIEELCAPYATVIDIHSENLPSAEKIMSWSGCELAAAIRHNPKEPLYNPDFRQLIHVSYKLAAECGGEYYEALERNRGIVGRQVTENLFERHIKILFN